MSKQNSKWTRRQFLKAAGLTAAGTVIAACTPAPAPTSAPPPTSAPAATVASEATAAPAATTAPAAAKLTGNLEVGVLYESGPWFDLQKSVGDSMIKDNPGLNIKYTFANTASDAARVLRWQAGDPLDIDFGRYNNDSPTSWTWADNDYVYDLGQHMQDTLPTGEKWGDTFLPVVDAIDTDSRDGSKTKGQRLAAGMELVLMLVQYNKKAFEEFGVEPAKTWPEFLQLCETIKSKGAAKGMKPICVSGPTFYYTCHWWDRLIQRIVGLEGVTKVLYGDGHVKDDPGFLTAAKEMQKLVDNDYLMDGYEGADFTSAQAMFFQGKAAMIHMGSWLSSEMKDSIPADYQLGAIDFPSYPDGKGDQLAMFGSSQSLSIPNPAKSTSHKVNVDAAVEFIKRRTSKAVCDQAAKTLAMIPPIKGVEPPPIYEKVDLAAAARPGAKLIPYYYSVHWDAALTQAWMVPTQALFLKKIKAEEMLDTIDKNLDQYRAMKAAGITPTAPSP